MKIIDLHGHEVEVTDLALSIMQADDYRHYRPIGTEAGVLHENRQRYWQDMYEKLLKLAEELPEDDHL